MKYMVTIDTEESWDWSGDYPVTHLDTAHIQRLGEFQSLCERHGTHCTYFVNDAVMSNPESADVIGALASRPGVEVGMHIHPWNTGPISQESVRARDTFLHNQPDPIIAEKLQTVLGHFHDRGLRPNSFRGGRYSSGGRITQFLLENRFVADCSVVPYTRWHDEGAPDYSMRGPHPQRIAPAHPGGHGLWEIPLSLGFTRQPFALWAEWFRRIEEGPLSRLRLIGLAERLGLVRRAWLNFELGQTHGWEQLIDQLAAMGVPCITFTVHSSSLFAGPGPYTRDKSQERQIFGRIDQVLSWVSNQRGLQPITASSMAQALESAHACDRHQSA